MIVLGTGLIAALAVDWRLQKTGIAPGRTDAQTDEPPKQCPSKNTQNFLPFGQRALRRIPLESSTQQLADQMPVEHHPGHDVTRPPYRTHRRMKPVGYAIGAHADHDDLVGERLAWNRAFQQLH